MILLLMHAEHSNLVAQQTFMFFLIATLTKDSKTLIKDSFTMFYYPFFDNDAEPKRMTSCL